MTGAPLQPGKCLCVFSTSGTHFSSDCPYHGKKGTMVAKIPQLMWWPYTTPAPKWCHAQLGVEGDTGHHLCEQEAGHKGAHTCDACRVKWRDGAAPKPVVEL